jgi:hypothetical protein
MMLARFAEVTVGRGLVRVACCAGCENGLLVGEE